MKATQTKFLDFLNGIKQFLIPIYQRTYSWSFKQCEQLWKDVVTAATDETITGHFIGSIVYIEKGLYQISSVPQFLVIDGQQRLTTLSLLLSCLGKVLEQRGIEGMISHRKINNYFLFNSEEVGELRYKLILSQEDRQTLIRVLEGKESQKEHSKKIVENYRFFENKIAEMEIEPQILYQGLAKLIIVDIALDRAHDNPQLIFESLNSTGLELSQADLIRNYVLMGLEPEKQESLYNEHWYPMEESFAKVNEQDKFDSFMRDYLTVKMEGKIPNIRGVYDAFKSFANGSRTDKIEKIVEDIHGYSKYFVRIALDQEEDRELRKAFIDIRTLKVDVAYPFILELYEDYSSSRLSHEEFLKILRLIESYVFRRAICGIPTNGLNKTFANISRELDKDHYFESLSAKLVLSVSNQRFPTDEEFIREMVVKDIYNFRSRNYCLSKLENYDRKERVVIEEYSIEHIMPQNPNLSESWKSELGKDWKDVHKSHLHLIGNLTLTGYNPELSDNPFNKKRDMPGGFSNSPLWLNRGLAKLEHWNKEEIEKRGLELAKRACKVWTYPKIDDKIREKYQKNENEDAKKKYDLKDHDLTPSMQELFEHLSRRILNLDSSVRQEIKKKYIAFKVTTNFVDVGPQKKCLLLYLNMAFDQVHDPKGLCRDVSSLGHLGNGDVEISLRSTDELDDVMDLVKQAFDIQFADE